MEEGRGGGRGEDKPWGLCFHSIILGQIENGIENISASCCVMSVFIVYFCFVIIRGYMNNLL